VDKVKMMRAARDLPKKDAMAEMIESLDRTIEMLMKEIPWLR
jgi:hypothetical protein